MPSGKTYRIVLFMLMGGVMTFVVEHLIFHPAYIATVPTRAVDARNQSTNFQPVVQRTQPLPDVVNPVNIQNQAQAALNQNPNNFNVNPNMFNGNPSYQANVDLANQLLQQNSQRLNSLANVPGSLLSQVVQAGQLPPGYQPNMAVPGAIGNMQNQQSAAIVPPLPPNAATSGQTNDQAETKILRWNGSGWTQLHKFCAGQTFKSTEVKSPAGNALIYIHDLKDDKWVSGSLKKHGMWDLPDVTVMVNFLRPDPEIGFMDIGSHVGTFSIVAALMGKKVVAVDPLVANVLRFCKSVQDNHFTDKITIFYTAISNTYGKVSFRRDLGNIGGTRIQPAPSGTNTSNIYDPDFIDTVRLDDLLPHIPFKKAFIKMDVEEHEYQVITSGGKFFEAVDVRGILMEWMWQKTSPNGGNLRDFLVSLNFAPYKPDQSMLLQLDAYKIWPNDVLWKKIR